MVQITSEQMLGGTGSQKGIAQSLIAVDLANDHVKIGVLKTASGKANIQDLREKKFSENEDDAIVSYLIDTYRDMKIKKRTAICVIPSSLCISKNVDMPSHDPQEIAKIVDLQAGRYTPYTRDEIVIDHLCMEVPEQHYTNVFLVIVHRKVIERYFQIFERAKIDVLRVLPASEGMAVAFDQMAGSQLTGEAVGGIHVDEDSSDFVVSDRQQMIFIRVIPVGAKHFRTNRESALIEFMKELNKSMLAYQNQGVGRPIKCLALSGLVNGLEYLENELRASVPYLFASNIPIKFASYLNYFTVSDQVAKYLETEQQISYFGMLSCLTFLPSMKLDLTPKEVKLKRQFIQSGKDMMTLGIFVMIIFFMISSYLGVKMYFKNLMIQKLDSQNDETFEQARLLEQVSTESRFLEDLLKKSGRPLTIYEKVTSLVGEDIYLSNLTFDNEGVLLLSGTAESMSRVFAFVTKLEASRYFKSVKTNETKSRRVGQSEVADFQIEARLGDELA